MVDAQSIKKAVIGVAAVLVVVIGIYILAKYGVGTGKAIEMPEGFYWEEGSEPELNPSKEDECEKAPVTIKPKVISLDSKESFSLPNACCSSEEVCGLSSLTFTLLSPNSYGCYKQNSYAPLYKPYIDKANFLCDKFDGKLNWYYCDKEGALSSNNKFICTNVNFKDYLNSKDKLIGKWQVCDEKTKSKLVSDKLCTGEKWLACDKDFKGKLSPEGSYWCDGSKWSNKFNMDFVLESGDGFYEVVAEKGKPAKDLGKPLGQTSLCDKNTGDLGSIATLCTINEIPVSSISKIASGNEKFQTYSGNGLSWLFLYEKEEVNKKVSIISLIDVSDQKEVKLALGTASKNLINSQRVAMLLDGQYYILSHPKDQLLSLSSLKVTHVPTLKEFSAEKIPANKVQFSVFAKKAIVINIDQGGDNLVITSAQPQEKAAAFVTPFKLAEEYEVPFDLENPAELIDVKRTITVCSNDKPADPQVLLVCLDDKYFFTLKKDVLTNVTINKQEAALLYQIVDGKKEAFIFLLKRLAKSDTDMLYNDFIDNLVSGKRVALLFEKSIYLLEHEGKMLSLPATELASFSEEGSTTFKALGSEKKVEYLIPEGKITLSRDFVQPPPPFKISALTKLEVLGVPLNLNELLFTTMSSQVPVNVQPDLGIVQKSDDDTIKNKDLFKIVSNLDKVGKQNLFFKQPVVIGDTLVYYFDASASGKDFIKMVKFYHLYDLTEQQQEHNFSNQFVDIFTAGNELALKFADSYYLLGYRGKSGFFSIKDLTLTTLEKQNQTLAETTPTTATFNVPEGKIKITVDDPNNKIYFESISSQILQIELFDVLNFSTLLTAEKRVKINNVEYHICDTGDIKYLKSQVYLCYGNSEEKLALGEEKFILENNDPGKPIVRYKYLGVLSGKKAILFQSIFALPLQPLQLPLEWSKTADTLARGKYPLIKKGEDYLELQGGEELNSFVLIDKKNNEYPIIMQSEEEAYENGTVVVNGEQVFFQKELVKNMIQLNVKLLDSKIIPEEGLIINNSGSFVAGVGGEKYDLTVAEKGAEKGLPMLTIKDSNGKYVFIGFMPVGWQKTVLLADGNVILIEVKDKTAVEITLAEWVLVE
ncbi:MAG: hypothetical protein AB1668_03880 [Nanoarchaeota archaeon]